MSSFITIFFSPFPCSSIVLLGLESKRALDFIYCQENEGKTCETSGSPVDTKVTTSGPQ